MCVIAFSPSRDTIPTRHQLNAACEANPDGFGWAVIAGSKIITHRTMDADEAISTYLAAAASPGAGLSLFHARITSHGTTDLSNCHPFSVDGDKDIVLAHNGILDIRPGPFDPRSDTAIFAAEVLPTSGIETLDTDLRTWEQWIGRSNKIVILSTSPRLARQAYVLNEAEGLWDGGTWWSNPSYRTLTRPGGQWDAWDAWDDDNTAMCAVCREYVPATEVEEQWDELWCAACVDELIAGAAPEAHRSIDNTPGSIG